MKPRFALNLLAVFACFASVVSCVSSVTISNKTVQGQYHLNEKDTWFAGEYLTLREKDFEYGRFTDVVGFAPFAKYPVRGKYTLDGCLLTLNHPAVDIPQRIITPYKGRFIILKPDEADLFLQKRTVSYMALYQSPLKQPR
ncbi:MAG: hypothetical protein ACYC67_07645 [Prosthecobacter sp.]|jgi:hypothetical protein